MKKLILFFILCCVCVFGADKIYYHSIQEALESKFAKKIIKDDVKFNFSKEFYDNDLQSVRSQKGSTKYRSKYNMQKHEIELIDEDYKTSCQYVFVNVLADLQRLARKANKSEIVNIQGYFKKQLYNDENKFQCAVGKAVTTVSLIANLK